MALTTIGILFCCIAALLAGLAAGALLHSAPAASLVTAGVGLVLVTYFQ
jgi:hypothetical protein